MHRKIPAFGRIWHLSSLLEFGEVARVSQSLISPPFVIKSGLQQKNDFANVIGKLGFVKASYSLHLQNYY